MKHYLRFIFIAAILLSADLIIVGTLSRNFITHSVRLCLPLTVILICPSNWLNKQDIGFKPVSIKKDLIWASKIALLIGVIVCVLGIILFIVFPSKFGFDKIEPIDIKSLSSAHEYLILGCFFTPIFEEILYRGLFVSVIESIAGKLVAIISSGIGFALLHLYYGRLPIYSIEYFLAGILLAWAFLKTRNIIVPIYLHFLGNLFVGIKDIGILLYLK